MLSITQNFTGTWEDFLKVVPSYKGEQLQITISVVKQGIETNEKSIESCLTQIWAEATS